MQVEQHMRNLRVIRGKVGKARTPKDHEAISTEITEAIKKIGCNPNKIFYTINNNKTPNFSVKKAIRTKVGTKKIGEGEYGEVFFGCVDKECKKDIAIKVQTEPLGIEYKIGKLVSKLGGVNMYALESCKGKHIMYSEYANEGALEDFINKNNRTLRPIHYRFMITQVLYNLYRIHKKYPSFRHSDLHAKNVLVNTDTPTLKINTYKIGNTTLKVEDVGLNLMLTDYGLSSTRVIKNPTTDGLDKDWGISQKSHPMYDTHLFLNAIFLVCSRIGTESAMETVRFIDRILPYEYKGSKTSKIMNFRMRINADHSNFPTFEKIFLDPYFLPYRSSNIKKKIDPLAFIPKAKPVPKPKAKTVEKKMASASGIQKAKNILARNAQKKAVPVKRRAPELKVTVAPKGYTRVDGKKCKTYKKSELIEKAKKVGIDTQGKTIEKICEALKIKYVK
jgi:hypothetical protein